MKLARCGKSRSYPALNTIFVGLLTTIYVAIGGCSPRTDFDRPAMSTINPNLISNPGSYTAVIDRRLIGAGATTSPAITSDGYRSDFKLTQQENAMRDLGYRLLTPLGRGHYSTAYVGARRHANRGVETRPLSDETTYYRWLKDGYERTAYSMWTRLIDDVRADEVSALRFNVAAQRVLKTDHDRRRIFLSRGDLDAKEQQNLEARITENRRYVETVLASMEDRTAAYAYAAERARVEVPSNHRAEAVAVITDLRAQSSELSFTLNRDYAAATGRATTRSETYDVISAPIIDLSRDQ